MHQQRGITQKMTACFGLRPFGGTKRSEKGSRNEEEAFGPAAPLNSFSSINSHYHELDALRANSETFIRPKLVDASIAENEQETKTNLEAAYRAVDIALSGLDFGGKRQIPSPTTLRQQQQDHHRPSPDLRTTPTTATRAGFPPKHVPRVFHRLKKVWNSNQQDALRDAIGNIRQTGSFSSYHTSAAELGYGNGNGNGHVINQFQNYYPNNMDPKTAAAVAAAAYNTNDIQGFYNQNTENLNLQYLQNILGNAGGAGMSNSFTAGCNYGPPNPDFCANLQNHKLSMLQNGVNELLLNSGDSFSSRISVPTLQNYRGDSFSSKLEFPISNDSFTSTRYSNSFTSQRENSQTTFSNIMLPKQQEEVEEEQFMDSAFSMPESVVAELESLADGNFKCELPEIRPGIQMDSKTKSEQALLVAIAGILKCVLEGNLKSDDLLSDLNFLIVSLRRHLSDHHNLSSNAAETFCSVVRTLPIVCRSANVHLDVVSSLQRFLHVLSSGHPILKNSYSCLANYDPKDVVNESQQSEARHLLTRIHRKLTGGHRSNGVQHVARALYESSEDIKEMISPTTNNSNAAEQLNGTTNNNNNHLKYINENRSSRSSGDSLSSFEIMEKNVRNSVSPSFDIVNNSDENANNESKID